MGSPFETIFSYRTIKLSLPVESADVMFSARSGAGIRSVNESQRLTFYLTVLHRNLLAVIDPDCGSLPQNPVTSSVSGGSISSAIGPTVRLSTRSGWKLGFGTRTNFKSSVFSQLIEGRIELLMNRAGSYLCGGD